jgi:hypothetical protein
MKKFLSGEEDHNYILGTLKPKLTHRSVEEYPTRFNSSKNSE